MEKAVVEYFHKDYTYEDMKNLLRKEHNIITSVSSIKRLLSSLGLQRKKIQESSLEEISWAIIQELYSAGCNLGYRSLWKKLKKVYNLRVKRDTVYKLLQLIDPDGLKSRFGNKLKRREYLSPGPNYIWHLDGYDKLKQFGFAVHGCIDGFSRMILWLEVATTNNDPRVTAYYFLTTLKKMNIIPTIIRADKGSENSSIADIQICLRSKHDDVFKGPKSYIAGKSVHNQRIESFWGQLRKHTADFYIQLFKCMQKENLFDGSNFDVMCLQFCFGPLIQSDLKLAKELWNEHNIRSQPGRNNHVSGKPNIIFHLPEKYGARDYRKEVDINSVENLLNSQYAKKPNLINPLIKQYVEEIVPEANKICSTPEEAVSLYKQIRSTKL